jgi:hypothetical protein
MTMRKKFPNRSLSFLIYGSVSTVQGHWFKYITAISILAAARVLRFWPFW